MHSKRVGKTSGMILSIKEFCESPAVPREDPENAVPAAKFAFIQGGRWRLGRDGRQAKAEYRFREDGKENAEILASPNCKNGLKYKKK